MKTQIITYYLTRKTKGFTFSGEGSIIRVRKITTLKVVIGCNNLMLEVGILSAYIKHKARRYYFDMSTIKADYTFLHANAKARAKHRALKRIDPFAHCIGARRKYETPDDLRRKCDAYFRSCMKPVKDKHGEIIRNDKGERVMEQDKPYTISGLARYLGITTNTLMTYHNKARAGLIPPEFADVVLEARQKIEEYAESQLYSRTGSFGGQFVLKNGFGWQTKKEQSETKAIRKKTKLLQKEFELKQKIVGLNEQEDSQIEIKITRANKEDDV